MDVHDWRWCWSPVIAGVLAMLIMVIGAIVKGGM